MPTVTAKRRVVPSTDIPPNQSPFADPAPNTQVRDDPPDMPEKPKSKAETDLIIAALTQFYGGVGLALFMVAPNDGRTVVSNADDLAESWRFLLDNDPKVRRALKKMVTGSGWGTVISAHLSIAVPIIQNHRGSLEHLIRSKRTANDSEAPENAAPTY